MGISGKIARRRAREWDVKTYTDISDIELEGIIRRIISRFPKCGEVMMLGHLRSQQVCVVTPCDNSISAGPIVNPPT